MCFIIYVVDGQHLHFVFILQLFIQEQLLISHFEVFFKTKYRFILLVCKTWHDIAHEAWLSSFAIKGYVIIYVVLSLVSTSYESRANILLNSFIQLFQNFVKISVKSLSTSGVTKNVQYF